MISFGVCPPVGLALLVVRSGQPEYDSGERGRWPQRRCLDENGESLAKVAMLGWIVGVSHEGALEL
jgi:hypothetical protein